MKNTFMAIGAIIVIVIAVIAFGRDNGDTNSATTATKKATQPTTLQPATGASVKEFKMTAKQWEFQPSTITVNKGDLVKLSVTSVDVSHGFGLPDFNVSEFLSPGKTVNIEFVADKVGSYSFFCNVACGVGHSGMRGVLIVQ